MVDISRTAIVISASSDIGAALCQRWLDRNWRVFGTYHTHSHLVEQIQSQGGQLFHFDLSSRESICKAAEYLQEQCPNWDVLVLAAGSQNPVGPFEECSFDEWEASVNLNFLAQMRIVHELLPYRNKNASQYPCVLFFAGGGTNNATVNYSAYTISKIALIKMCELLDAEIQDTSFFIIGPGWVKTKIHTATLNAGNRAGTNYQRTLEKLASNDCTPMEEVLDCCDWGISAPRKIVSGRNFSVVYDMWDTTDLSKMLIQYPDMYKLRRSGNDWLVKQH